MSDNPAPPPTSGESWSSWLQRVASERDTPLGTTLDDLRVARNANGTVPRWGVHVPEMQLALVARNAAVPMDRLASTLLTTFCRTSLGFVDLRLRRHRTRPADREPLWAMFHRTRVCGACVFESGALSVAWKLHTSYACTAHGTVLVDECPECRTPLESGFGTRTHPAFPDLVPVPTACQNAVESDDGYRPCGFPLSELPARRASRGTLSAQYVLDDASAARTEFTGVAVGGRDVPLLDWFAALRDVCALLSTFAEVDDLRAESEEAVLAFVSLTSTRPAPDEATLSSFRAPPATAALASAILPTAVSILASDDLPGALSLLVERARAALGDHVRIVPDRMRLSPALRAAVEDAATGHAAFGRLSGFLALGAPAGGYGFGPHHVPHLATPEQYAEVSDLLGDVPERSGRQFLALSLVRAAERCSWNDAAVWLGVAPVAARKTVATCVSAISDAASYWEAVHAIASALDAGPLTDYAHRRWALRAMSDMPEHAWVDECQFAGVHPGRGPQRRRSAVAWAWAWATGGDPLASPAFLAAAQTAGWSRTLDAYRRFEAWMPPELADSLRMYVLDIVEGVRPNSQ